MNSRREICQNCQQEFRIEPEDFAFYEKMEVPPPTFCPECRLQRRMIWRNEIVFYKRICDATGNEIFSMFSPKAPVNVYDRDYWWSDKWDPLAYGREYDFKRPFFEQLKELIQTVPWPSRSFLDNVGSEYCMNCSYLKNCYMLFDADSCEDSSYGVGINKLKNCFDNLSLDSCELCYECFFCARCYRAFYCSNCEDSSDITFSKDCVNCRNCFGCVGLRNKSYCIFNEQYSKEEYFRKIAEFKGGSYKSFLQNKKKALDFFRTFPVRYMHGSHNQDVSGDYIYNSKNVHDSYTVRTIEDSRYCAVIKALPGGARQCYDYDLFGWNAELIYECNNVGYNASNVKFSVLVYLNARDIEYSLSCISSVHDLFGCVGLQKKQYCILNKQYTRSEYFKMIPKIKNHMNKMPYVDARGRIYKYGEFIPVELSPFGYNEAIVQEYMPLSKEAARKAGFPWRESIAKEYPVTLSWADLPDSIDDADDSILKETILCRAWDTDKEKAQQHNCSKAFRITARELAFYREMNLPLPRKCFYSRHYDRTLQRNPIRKQYRRQCMCDYQVHRNLAEHTHPVRSRCLNEFKTSYSPERPEIVYCQQCYQAEVT